jgi:hypothetical protein
LCGFEALEDPKCLLHNNSLLEIKADRMPIGFSDVMDANYTLHKINIKPKDVFYILTDGYFDQIGGLNNKKFLSKRFREKIVSIKDHNIEMQKSLLNDTINVWKGDNEQIDDILVIGCKVPENISNFSALHYGDKYENIIFDHKGEITRGTVIVILDEVEDKLIKMDMHKKYVKKIIIVITELIQNIVNCFDSCKEIENKTFSLTIKQDGKFFSVECSNFVSLPDFNLVKSRIEKLNELNEEKLQNLYRQQLESGVVFKGQGAGLGLIVIAQRSLKPITCELINIDGISYIMKLNLVISCE